MYITEIKEQKQHKDRYSVFVDAKYSFSLSGNDLLEQKINIGQEILQSDIDKMKRLSADSLLLIKAYDKCLRRPHSIKEIKDYLRRKDADDDLIDSIIDKCLAKKLLNDQNFAERWYEHRKNSNRSNRFITSELYKKGVEKAIIEDVVNEDDNSALKDAILKKRRKYDDPRKLIVYLQRQGFSYYEITEALKNEED